MVLELSKLGKCCSIFNILLAAPASARAIFLGVVDFVVGDDDSFIMVRHQLREGVEVKTLQVAYALFLPLSPGVRLGNV